MLLTIVLQSDSMMLKKHHVFNIHCQMENWGQQLNMRLQMVSDQMNQIGPTGLADSLLFVKQLQDELNAIEKAHFDNSTSGQLCQVWPQSQFFCLFTFCSKTLT